MNIELFTLCDFAQQYEGKLTIVGSYNNLRVSSFPYTVPALTLVGKVGFEKAEIKREGEVEFQITFENKLTGENVINPFHSTIKTLDFKGEFVYFNIVLNMGNLKLREAGDYLISLKINGKVKTTQLHVSEEVK